MSKFLLTKEDNDSAMDEAYNGLVGFLDDRMSGEKKKRLAPPPAEEVPGEIEAEAEPEDGTPSDSELDEVLRHLGE